MDTRSYKTKVSFAKDEKSWLLVDAENEILGRIASKVAYLLRGKHKPSFTPHLDMGDNVIVINAQKVRFTGKKLTDKQYVRHTGYPGGQRYGTPKKMLPATRLGEAIFKNLHVFAGDKHEHESQQPHAVSLKTLLEKKSK